MGISVGITLKVIDKGLDEAAVVSMTADEGLDEAAVVSKTALYTTVQTSCDLDAQLSQKDMAYLSSLHT